MYIEYNPNPIARKNAMDCPMRAVAKALDTDWESAFAMLCKNAFLMGDSPNSKVVVDSIIRQNGFKRGVIPNTCPDCYTAKQFCADNPVGVFVLCFDDHIATVDNGNLYDAWNSENEVPLFVWYKDDQPKEITNAATNNRNVQSAVR